MKISNAFTSQYLKAADLDDKPVKFLMDRVEMEDVGGDPKPILFFQGQDKGLVLNKTNSNNIADAYGDDTDGWAGREIVLYPAMTDFQGKTVPCIRVRKPKPTNSGLRPNPNITTGRQVRQTENPADADF